MAIRGRSPSHRGLRAFPRSSPRSLLSPIDRARLTSSSRRASLAVPSLRSANMMETRPSASLAPLRGRPARLLRIDDSNERYERLRNPFDRELAPRPGRIAADRRRAREPGDLREPGRDRARRSLAPRNLSLRSERGSRSNPPGSMNNDQAILTQWAGACGDREKEAARTGGPSLPRRSVGSTGCLSAGACGPSRRRTCARRTCPNRRVPGR